MARRFGRKRRGGRRKRSMVGILRGGIYAASLVIPIYQAYQQNKNSGLDTWDALAQTLRNLGGIGSDGQFSWDVIKQMYAPIAVWTAVDTGLSYAGVYKKMGRLLR